MSVSKLTQAQIEKLSMIEMANIILAKERKELNFLELFEKVAEEKQFTQTQKDELLARFYTDLNIDGRFMTLGSNVWGLKRWYPVDHTSEKALAETRKREAEEDDEFLDEELEEPDAEVAELGETIEASYEDEYDELEYDIDDVQEE